MICDINNDSINKLGIHLANKLSKKKTPFTEDTLREFVEDIYVMVEETTDNPDQALAYARLVPQLVYDIIEYTPGLRETLNIKKIGFIKDQADEFADKEEGLDNVEKYLGIEAKSQDDIDEEINDERETKKTIKNEAKLNSKLSKLIDKEDYDPEIPPSALATFGTDMDANGNLIATEIFHYDALRKVLDKYFSNPQSVNRFSDFTLVAMAFENFKSQYPDAVKKGSKLADNDVVLVLADENNEIIIYNESYDKVSEDEGKPVYFEMYNPNKNEDRALKHLTRLLFPRIKKWDKLSDTQKKKVIDNYKREKNIAEGIKSFFKDNPEYTLSLTIAGGSYGKKKYNNLSEFAIVNGISNKDFNPQIDDSDSYKGVEITPSYFEYKGQIYYFKSKTGFHSTDTETVLSLMFDDIMVNGKLITIDQRRRELAKIFNIGYPNEANTALVDNDEITVTLVKGKYKVRAKMNENKTSTNIDAESKKDISDLDYRDILKRHFNNVGFYHINKELINKNSKFELPKIVEEIKKGKTYKTIEYEKLERGYKGFILSDKFMILNPRQSNPYLLFEPNSDSFQVLKDYDDAFMTYGYSIPKSIMEQLREIDYSEVPDTYRDALNEANERKRKGQVFKSSKFDGIKPKWLGGKVRYTIRPELDSKYRPKNKNKKEATGVSILKLIKNGDATRFDVQEQWYNDYGKPKVGDIYWFEDTNLNLAELIKVTAVYGRTDKRYKENFYKTGWDKAVFQYEDKGKPFKSIEFERIDLKAIPKTPVKVDDVRKGKTGPKTKDVTKKEPVATKENKITKPGPADESVVNRLRNKTFDKLIDLKGNEIQATPEQLEQARIWYESSPLSKYFPFEVVFNAVNRLNSNAVASWTIDGIILAKGSDYSDLYHEAWHGFTQTFLTQKQREAMYNEVSKYEGSFKNYIGKTVKFSEATELELEEYLAENFREYMLSDGTKLSNPSPVKKSLFEKILSWLKELFKNIGIYDVITNPNQLYTVNELFTKLRVGDLTDLNFDAKNASFKELYSTIKPVDSKLRKRGAYSYQETKLITDTIDSIFSQLVDEQILKGREEASDKTEEYAANRFTVTMYRSEKNKLTAYDTVYEIFEQEILPKLKKQLKQKKEKSPEQVKEIERIKNTIDLLNRALKDFGDLTSLSANIDLGGGVIYQHMMNSKIMSAEDKEDFLEDLKESQANREAKYDRSGADSALKDLAAAEVIYLIKSLNEYDKKGKLVLNEFNWPKLAEFDKTWNFLARNLEGSLSAQDMYDKLNKLAEEYPVIAQLLNKLGPFDTRNTISQDLWTKFWQAFNKTRVPLIQMILNEQGDNKYMITIGYAQGEYRKVIKGWNDNFQVSLTDFIKEKTLEEIQKEKIVITTKYLDLEAVLEKYPKVIGLEPNELIQFLNDIGIGLSNTKEIRQAVRNDQEIKNSISYLHKRLIDLNKYGIEVYDVETMFDEHQVESKTKEGILLGDMYNRLNDLSELQARLGDSVSNFMVSNAEGNAQFEHSLNNSMLVMTNAVNKVDTEDELYSMGYMSHLDPRRNPFMRRTLWKQSLFNEDGERRKLADGNDVIIKVDNVSGVSRLDEYGNSDGVISAESDPFTKFLMDFHTMSLRGTPEFMKHSDKGSSYTGYVTDIINWYPEVYGKKINKNKYIDDADFLIYQDKIIKSNENTNGKDLFYEILQGYLLSEIERINKVRDILDSPTTPFDYKYAQRGSNFVIFDGILTANTKKDLLQIRKDLTYDNIDKKGETLDSYLRDKKKSKLANDIEKQIKNYLDKQFNGIKKLLENANYVDPRVEKALRKDLNLKLKNIKNIPGKEQFRDAAIMSVAANAWIHNMESMIMLYGDVAQYDLDKEEFHKRNAGIASTGDIFRTDKTMIDFINNVLGRKYDAVAQEMLQSKYGIKDEIDTRTMAVDGSMNTVIFEDPKKLNTRYLEEYQKALEKFFKERYTKKEDWEKATKKAVDAYTDRKEGDAQGWITLDSYRQLLVAEGKWDFFEQEKMYNDIIEGKNIDITKIVKFFPVKKLQYWGPLKTTDENGNPSGLPLTAMHKFSLMPLIPNIIKDTNLEKLHLKMIKDGIDYATFTSGSKISTITKGLNQTDTFYSDVNSKMFDMESVLTPNTIYIQFLKDQLETGEVYKGKVPFPTQMRKLLIDGLVENGIPTDWKPELKDRNDRIKAWEKVKDKLSASKNSRLYTEFERLVGELTDTKYDELLAKIGWTKDKNGNPIGDISKLKDYVIKNLELQDLAQHELDFIQIEKGRWKFDMSLSFSADKIEKLLNAIVVKEIIRQKVKGEPLIQVARTGWEKPSQEDLLKYGDDLPFYHQSKDKDGNSVTAAMKIKIALQGDFVNLLNHADVKKKIDELALKNKKVSKLEALNILIKDEEWLNRDDNRKMVTMTAVRIPTQGLNSMDFMEVYEFLPANAPNIIIMPSEIVAKSGSDFDIDKMFTLMPHIFYKYGELKYLENGKRLTPEEYENLVDRRNKLETDKQNIYTEFEDILNSTDFKKDFPFNDDQIASLREINKVYNTKIKVLNKKIIELERLEAKRLAGKETQETEQLIDAELYDAYTERDLLYEEHFAEKRNFYSSVNKENIDKLYADRDNKLKPIDKELFNISYKIKSGSSKGIENALLTSIRNILENPTNYASLIRPNATDIFDDLAADMAQYSTDYDPYEEPIKGEGVRLTGKGKKAISGTRIFELPYNLYKQYTNNVGKQTLGIAAVENTYNILFNRIGMYMNAAVGLSPEEFKKAVAKYKELVAIKDKKGKLPKGMSKKDFSDEIKDLKESIKASDIQTLQLNHNTFVKNGETVISLSNIYDANNEHKISDVISQMINGFVDVAKDAWIFNVQGNKEVAPTLLFLVQSGVPINEAVYFVSNPLIREYVELQRKKKSTFSGPLGVQPRKENLFNYESKMEILDKYGITPKIAAKDRKTKEVMFYYYDVVNFKEKQLDYFKKYGDKMRGKNAAEILKSRLSTGKDKKKINELDKAIFLHYLQAEEMGKALTQLKRTANPDTSKARTLFEASAKQLAIAELKNNARIPTEMIDKFETETSIGSFFRALGYQEKIWGDAFKIRNNKSLKEKLLSIIQSPDRTIMESTYDDPEKFVKMYINDFMVYLFQNKLYDFDLRYVTAYKGTLNDQNIPVKASKYLPSGVFFDKGKFYVDKNQLANDFINLDSLDSYRDPNRQYKFAPVSKRLFNTEKEYFKFVFEREYLRSQYTIDDMEVNFLYQYNLKKNKNLNKGTKLKDEIELMTYEDTLRDMALMNTYNLAHMFESKGSSMAEILMLIKQEFPDLVKNYPVLQSLTINKGGNGLVKNIKLGENAKDSEMLNIYHENMLELMDYTQIQTDASEANKKIISDFFSKLPFYSILQSGFDTNTALSIQRVMPNDTFLEYISDVVKPYTKQDKEIDSDVLDQYTQRFVKQNSITAGKPVKRNKYKAYNYGIEVETEEEIETEDVETMLSSAISMSVDYNDKLTMSITPYEKWKKIPGNGNASINNYIAEIAEYINQTKNKIFVFNDVVYEAKGVLSNAKYNDWILKRVLNDYYDTLKDKIVGLPTRKNYSQKASDALIPDYGNTPDDQFVTELDDQMDYLAEQKRMGVEIIFNKAGYGQVLIGADDATGLIDRSKKALKTAPANFDYLSHRLLKDLDYFNPNYKNEEQIKKVEKIIYTPEDYLDKINYCLS